LSKFRKIIHPDLLELLLIFRRWTGGLGFVHVTDAATNHDEQIAIKLEHHVLDPVANLLQRRSQQQQDRPDRHDIEHLALAGSGWSPATASGVDSGHCSTSETQPRA